MERRTIVKVVSVLLVVAMLFPLALVSIAAQPVDAVEPTDAVGTVREVPLSIEVLENTRELVRVKVNDILITQEVDPNYSTNTT